MSTCASNDRRKTDIMGWFAHALQLLPEQWRELPGVPKIVNLIDEVNDLGRLGAKVTLWKGKYIRYIEIHFRD